MSPKFTLPAAIRAKFKAYGSQGGKKGVGEKKRRSVAHYARLSALGVAAREAKRVRNLPPAEC